MLNLRINQPLTRGKHIFIAYRKNVEEIARKVAIYLAKYNLKVWFFPWKVGWGDSITIEEEKGIRDSFAGLIIFTPDFLGGKTTSEEYKALAAKKREDPHFKLGVLLVNCDPQTLPPFLKDCFAVKLNSYEGPEFTKALEKIRRGLLGLPLESIELWDELYDFAMHEIGYDIMESEALEFVNFWFSYMSQYDFKVFKKVYYYAKEHFFGECPFEVPMTDEYGNSFGEVVTSPRNDLAKDFAIEFVRNVPTSKINKILKLFYDLVSSQPEYALMG